MISRERPLIIITGGTGQIGFELVRALSPLGEVLAPRRAELDLTRPAQMRAYLRERRPSLIVNAAAYTAVDRAETEPDLCYTINAEAPGVLAEEARRADAALLHYSTDYVFDGRKRTPYIESDSPSPLNVYGASKLAGERAIEAAGGTWLVLRTSWVFGARRGNFVRTIRRLARDARPIRVVMDQSGTPTWSRSVAIATAELLARSRDQRWSELLRSHAGVYHLTSAESTTWLEFARAILARDPARHEHCYTSLDPITSREFSAAAERPAYSVLSSERARTTFGLRLPPWEAQLSALFADGDFN